MKNRPAPAAIDRERAVGAKPHQLPVVRREHANGKLRVTVRVTRPRWQRWLGSGGLCERTFALDAFGEEVYGACDGTHTVAEIARAFATSHHLSIAEAELAVSTFLKTLMSRGLIAMEIAKGIA